MTSRSGVRSDNLADQQGGPYPRIPEFENIACYRDETARVRQMEHHPAGNPQTVEILELAYTAHQTVLYRYAMKVDESLFGFLGPKYDFSICLQIPTCSSEEWPDIRCWNQTKYSPYMNDKRRIVVHSRFWCHSCTFFTETCERVLPRCYV